MGSWDYTQRFPNDKQDSGGTEDDKDREPQTSPNTSYNFYADVGVAGDLTALVYVHQASPPATLTSCAHKATLQGPSNRVRRGLRQAARVHSLCLCKHRLSFLYSTKLLTGLFIKVLVQLDSYATLYGSGVASTNEAPKLCFGVDAGVELFGAVNAP